MHTDQIYIARDGKSGMHVLVRILAVDDIGADYPPIDPDNFNKLMMARDVKSLVLAARDLGSMYMSVDSRPGRTFIPSHLQQDIECGFNLVPPDLESLLSECYFDPYALPIETDDMGYRAIGRTGKKSTRELIDELDFTKAGDLSYLDSRFRAIVEPLHDWIFARNLLSIIMRIGGQTLHPDMQRFMESFLGCKVEILLDSEKAGERILSTLGLKDYVDAKAELERLDSEIAEKKTQLNEILRQEHEARERLAELVCSAETLPSVKAS